MGSATFPPRDPSFDARFSEVSMLLRAFTHSLTHSRTHSHSLTHQEPGSNNEVRAFAEGKGAKWSIMGKLSCQSSKSHPLFQWLQQNGDLQWNFHKFLIDRDGKLVKNFEPGTSPMSIEPEIVKLLK